MTRSPADYARWVRQVHRVSDEGAVDVRTLVEQCGGRVDDAPLRNCAGLLLPIDDGFFGVLLKEDDPERRKRFTIAHELGHFCIPSHRRRAALCSVRDFSSGATARPTEREANEFAVELLMPRRAVEKTIGNGSLSISRAISISDAFDVSRVSAALRMCELSRDASAVVYFRNGKIEWAMRFKMPFGIPDTGTLAPQGSVAFDVISGRSGSLTGLAVESATWLPLAANPTMYGEVLESTVPLDLPGEALTVLWLSQPDGSLDD